MKNNVAVEQLGSCSDFHALNSANTTCIGYDTIHSILCPVYCLTVLFDNLSPGPLWSVTFVQINLTSARLELKRLYIRTNLQSAKNRDN